MVLLASLEDGVGVFDLGGARSSTGKRRTSS
jgi:hypothetical protein